MKTASKSLGVAVSVLFVAVATSALAQHRGGGGQSSGARGGGGNSGWQGGGANSGSRGGGGNQGWQGGGNSGWRGSGGNHGGQGGGSGWHGGSGYGSSGHGWVGHRHYGYGSYGYYPRYGYYPYYGYYAPFIGYYGSSYYGYPYYPEPYYYTYTAPPPVYYQAPQLAQVTPPPPPPPAPQAPPAPQPTPAPPTFERYTLSAQELFEFDRSKLRMPQPKLDEIAAALNANPHIGGVRITGYTDRLGSDSYNMQLSKRRADAVKSYLVGKGVAAIRLNAEGRGKSNPLVQCSQTNRAALIKCLEPNRRVEVEQITLERPR